MSDSSRNARPEGEKGRHQPTTVWIGPNLRPESPSQSAEDVGPRAVIRAMPGQDVAESAGQSWVFSAWVLSSAIWETSQGLLEHTGDPEATKERSRSWDQSVARGPGPARRHAATTADQPMPR